jgi:hypothetical protein
MTIADPRQLSFENVLVLTRSYDYQLEYNKNVAKRIAFGHMHKCSTLRKYRILRELLRINCGLG